MKLLFVYWNCLQNAPKLPNLGAGRQARDHTMYPNSPAQGRGAKHETASWYQVSLKRADRPGRVARHCSRDAGQLPSHSFHHNSCYQYVFCQIVKYPVVIITCLILWEEQPVLSMKLLFVYWKCL